MAVQKQRRRLFRIFYSTSFTFVFLLVAAFIVVSPADAVWQAYKDVRYLDIFIIAGVYVLTGIVAVLILASRIYTNRSIVAGIPKTYIPIEVDEIGKKRVYKLIKEALDRNAVIAYNARPKVIPEDEDDNDIGNLSSTITGSSRDTKQQKQQKHQTRQQQWKSIAHPGWSSPYSPDLPHLQYDTVIEELPALIEAKAVSLAPTDAAFRPDDSNDASEPFTGNAPSHLPAIPDGRIVDLLQQPDNMSTRDYIEYLISLNVIQPESLGKHFLALYEHARFSGHPLTESEFRHLMAVFAEVLRSMTRLDPDLVSDIQETIPLSSESEETDGYETPTPASEYSTADSSSHPSSSMSTAASWQTQRRHHINGREDESGSEDAGSLRTAPLTQPRGSTYAQSRSASRPQLVSRLASGSSLRPTRSNVSMASRSSARSGGSVIRLATPVDGPLNLPYVIDFDR